MFRTICSLQYNIPAIGHHYGNAFAPDDEEDDDDDEEEDCSGLVPGALDAYSQSSMNMVSTTDGEFYDDEEEEIDVSFGWISCCVGNGGDDDLYPCRRTSKCRQQSR